MPAGDQDLHVIRHVDLPLFPSVIPDIFNRESSVFAFSCVLEEKDLGFLLPQE